MNTTTHLVAPEEVMAWLDGELSSAEARTVAVHLDTCAECANLAAQFRATAQSLSVWSVPELPSYLDESVSKLAVESTSAAKSNRPHPTLRAGFWSWKSWAIGSGGAVIALFILFVVTSPIWFHSGKPVAHEEGLQTYIEPPFASQAIDRPAITDPQAKVLKDKNKPQEGESRALDSLVTLTRPDVAPDSNGRFHGLGDHVRNSFSIDGQAPSAPVPMIARTASLTIVVKNFAASRASLDTILARHHGYSAQLAVSTPENAPRSFQASLRVPAPELSSAVDDLKTLGRIENESQSGEDVTQQHNDLAARLKTSRETEARFEAILQQRTGNVAEVLQVEEGIARVRGDIERMEAEQTILEHRVDFATVEIQLSEEFKAQLNLPSASVANRIHNAFVAGIRNASATLLGIVLFFERYAPVLLIWLAILGLPVLLVRRRYRKARGQL
jgi:hypothetical protein